MESGNQATSPVPLRYPPKKDNFFMETQQHKDVYKPMLSEFIVDLSASDLKVHEQWIVRRKQVIYFGAIAAIFTVLLCAVGFIYVIPQLCYGDLSVEEYTKTIVEVTDPEPNNSPAVQPMQLKLLDVDYEFPEYSSPEEDDTFDNLEEDDLNSLNTEIATDENEEYLYCIISSFPEFSKFTNSCNSVVFRDITDEDADLTQCFSEDDLDVNSIVNVRVTSPLSEKVLQKIVRAFPNIGRLTVGIDKLCLGSYETNRENLPSIDLPQLETLEVVNATRCPDLASWLFSKWNTPAIQKVSIAQADIPRSVFNSLTGFIERHNETLISVDFIRCSFGNCNIDVIPLYHNLTITETETRQRK